MAIKQCSSLSVCSSFLRAASPTLHFVSIMEMKTFTNGVKFPTLSYSQLIVT